jgi:RNA polymerase sigma-19 factor, ECF subfamily
MAFQGSKNPLESRRVTSGSGMALEACRSRLHRFLMRRLRRRVDARDLLQEAYVRFLQTPDHELIREPMAYLYRVAANLAHDVERREGQDFVTFDSEAAEEAAEATAEIWRDEVADPVSAEQSLEALLSQLPEIYQAVLLLRKRDGLSCEQIAQELGISKHTAEKYLYRAIAQVRMAYQAD